jgi:hypothetical protein
VSAASASPRAAAQAAPGFEPAATLGAREPAPSAAVGGVSGVGSLEALLALQEAPGPIERRRRAVRRAGRLLDVLDAVKLSLLDGEPPAAALIALTSALADQRSKTDEEALEGVLDEIETRALVEQAKAEVARQTPPNAA